MIHDKAGWFGSVALSKAMTVDSLRRQSDADKPKIRGGLKYRSKSSSSLAVHQSSHQRLLVYCERSCDKMLIWPVLPAFYLASSANPVFAAPYENASKDCPRYRSTCQSYAVRQEYGALTQDQKLDFIRSIQCLQTKPSIIPSNLAPGARNRYDDFIATHINQTLHVHGDGIFLAWHREFIHLFEKALQDECNYDGTLPYWDWPRYASNISAAPMFDGSEYSLSGDGVYNSSQEQLYVGPVALPYGSGGGPVQTGPFANMTLHFQNFPQNLSITAGGVLPDNALDYFPHPFRRSLNQAVSDAYFNQKIVTRLINRTHHIGGFQNTINGGLQGLSIHPAGHGSLGQDMWDFFASPSGE